MAKPVKKQCNYWMNSVDSCKILYPFRRLWYGVENKWLKCKSYG